jgi:hypothetical protein
MKSVIVLGLAISVSMIAAVWSPSPKEPSGSENTSTAKLRNQGLDFKKIGKDYRVRLHSAKAEVVESALEPIIYMRIAFPKEDFREIEQTLYDLASRGATRSIRYKAYLAIQVFADPAGFKGAVESRQLSGEEFYAELAGKIRL